MIESSKNCREQKRDQLSKTRSIDSTSDETFRVTQGLYTAFTSVSATITVLEWISSRLISSFFPKRSFPSSRRSRFIHLNDLRTQSYIRERIWFVKMLAKWLNEWEANIRCIQISYFISLFVPQPTTTDRQIEQKWVRSLPFACHPPDRSIDRSSWSSLGDVDSSAIRALQRNDLVLSRTSKTSLIHRRWVISTNRCVPELQVADNQPLHRRQVRSDLVFVLIQLEKQKSTRSIERSQPLLTLSHLGACRLLLTCVYEGECHGNLSFPVFCFVLPDDLCFW